MGDRLAGKIAIVTGAGSGIGRASAVRFAEESIRPSSGVTMFSTPSRLRFIQAA